MVLCKIKPHETNLFIYPINQPLLIFELEMDILGKGELRENKAAQAIYSRKESFFWYGTPNMMLRFANRTLSKMITDL